MARLIELDDGIGENYLDRMLYIKLHPESCGRTECGNSGAVLKFDVHFSVLNFTIENHRVALGLKGGELLLDIGDGTARTLEPEPEIETEVDKMETQSSSLSATLDKSGLSISPEWTRTSESHKLFATVTPSGIGSSNPSWTIKSHSGQLLRGRVPSIVAGLQKNPLCCCRCNFRYATVPADWGLEFELSSNIPWWQRLHLRPAIKKRSSSLLALYSMASILSEGDWYCPIFKENSNGQK